jgi:hypothetical protein
LAPRLAIATLFRRGFMHTTSAFLFVFITAFTFFTGVPSAATPNVILDSLSGNAEVQRAGTTRWKPVKPGSLLYNNDVIRIFPKGYGRVQWPDKSVVHMKGGSQILVNIGQPKTTEKLLNYATVFMGSVFFVIKKSMPLPRKENIQIYTPTTVISIRGTSFSLDVAPETGTTALKVVCGTVRVSCIAKHASAFVSAPYKTTVEKMTDPIISNPMHDAEIDSLRAWVPDTVISRELSLHLAEGKRNQMIISGRMEKKCIITPFKNSSTYRGEWDLSHRIPEMLSERLRNVSPHCKISVSDSGLQPSSDTGSKSGQQYRIAGSVTFLDIVNHAEITVRADEYRERSNARVQIDLTLFDVTGDTELLQTTVTGEYSGKKSVENSMKTIGAMEFNLENEEFAGSLIGVALKQALEQAVEKLTTTIFQ